MKVILISVIFLCVEVITLNAQNFDADSVYYSVIPKNNNQVRKKSSNDSDIEASKKVSYFFNVQSGVLIGCKDCSFKHEVTVSAATTHGITIGKKLRLGAGVGFDSYQNWQTFPLFGSVSWDLFGSKNRNALFIQFDYGSAKPKANELTYSPYKDFDTGRMVSTQIGYRINYHDLKISLAIGSKYQRINASYQYPSYRYDFRGTPIIGTPNTTTLRESINRFSLMMAIGWK